MNAFISFAHVFAFGFSAALIVLADKEAVAWFRGKRPTLDPQKLHLYHTLTWVGLLLLGTSGFLLLYPNRLYLLEEPLFITKLLFVGALLVNAVLIGRLQHIAVERSYSELTFRETLPLFASGAVSATCWTVAAVLGYIVANF